MNQINYKNGRKNNWRRTVFNQVSARVSARDAIVVYLPGPQDLDRQVLCEKGFSPNNLIAVDKDRNVVASLRSKNKVAIKIIFFHYIYIIFLLFLSLSHFNGKS